MQQNQFFQRGNGRCWYGMCPSSKHLTCEVKCPGPKQNLSNFYASVLHASVHIISCQLQLASDTVRTLTSPQKVAVDLYRIAPYQYHTQCVQSMDGKYSDSTEYTELHQPYPCVFSQSTASILTQLNTATGRRQTLLKRATVSVEKKKRNEGKGERMQSPEALQVFCFGLPACLLEKTSQSTGRSVLACTSYCLLVSLSCLFDNRLSTGTRKLAWTATAHKYFISPPLV